MASMERNNVQWHVMPNENSRVKGKIFQELEFSEKFMSETCTLREILT